MVSKTRTSEHLQASLSSVALRVRRRLQRTQRTVFKHTVIVRSRPSPVPGLDRVLRSGLGETTEGAPHQGQELRESSGSPGLSSSRQDRNETPPIRSPLQSKQDSKPESSVISTHEPSEDIPERVLRRADRETGPSKDTTVPSEDSQSSQKDSEDCEEGLVVEEDLNNIIKNNEFHAKYQVTAGLKRGGSSVVYSGIRREDGSPVAIKRVLKYNITWSTENLPSVPSSVPSLPSLPSVPVEVDLLSRLSPGLGLSPVPGPGPGPSPGSVHSRVSPLLLDWFDVDQEFIIVLERPEPCMDLVDYINSQGRYMTEEEARVIFRQLLDAVVEMLALGIFHRDIKPDNILIETGLDQPRARFIDFDCGTSFYTNQVFKVFSGTDTYAPPEFYRVGRYTARPTTVWQLGLSLYCMLHMKRPFASVNTLSSNRQPPLRTQLSDDCKNLLRRLLDKNPITRICIDSIKDQPWMN